MAATITLKTMNQTPTVAPAAAQMLKQAATATATNAARAATATKAAVAATPSKFVYLHGLGSGANSHHAKSFNSEFVDKHARDLHIPVLDPDNFKSISFKGMVDRAREAIKAHKGPVGLIGVDIGAYVAALLAAEKESNVKAVVMMAPTFRFRERWHDILSKAKVDGWKRDGKVMMHHHETNSPQPLPYSFYEETVNFRDEPKVQAPMLVFIGSQDRVVPVATVKDFLAIQPSTVLRVVEDDHTMLKWTPDIVKQTVEFFDKHVK